MTLRVKIPPKVENILTRLKEAGYEAFLVGGCVRDALLGIPCEDFDIAYPETVAKIRSEEYYVNMMTAWYFATALAKQYDAVLPYIENRRLDDWTHNKAIQKAIESYRITPEQKAYLKTLKTTRKSK